MLQNFSAETPTCAANKELSACVVQSAIKDPLPCHLKQGLTHLLQRSRDELLHQGVSVLSKRINSIDQSAAL